METCCTPMPPQHLPGGEAQGWCHEGPLRMLGVFLSSHSETPMTPGWWLSYILFGWNEMHMWLRGSCDRTHMASESSLCLVCTELRNRVMSLPWCYCGGPTGCCKVSGGYSVTPRSVGCELTNHRVGAQPWAAQTLTPSVHWLLQFPSPVNWTPYNK